MHDNGELIMNCFKRTGAVRVLMVIVGNIFIGLGVGLFKLTALGNDPFDGMNMAMADFFGTSVDYLIGHTDVPNIIEEVCPHDLNAREATLIRGFRSLSEEERKSILQIIDNYNRYK